MPVVAHRLECGGGGNRDGRGLLERDVGGKHRHRAAFRNAEIPANAPPLAPNTPSPGWNRETVFPTDSTMPAKSVPSTAPFGSRPVPRIGYPALLRG